MFTLTENTFTLTENQQARLAEWKKNHPPSRAADGGQYEYSFFPTSLGDVVKVKCHVTHTEIDLTEYDTW